MYCHHRHLRGLAGSRACFPRPKNAHSARAISFFLYLFHGKRLAQQSLVDIFLCNHKHIQSFVNSVLIIAKTLSLSLLLSRARLVSRHRRKRERERKKEREKEIYNINFFFSCEEKKGVRMKKRREGKRLEKRPRKPWQKRRHKIIIFARPLSLSLSIL